MIPTMEQTVMTLQKMSKKDYALAARMIENIASADEYMSRSEVNNCVDRLCKKYNRAFKELAK